MMKTSGRSKTMATKEQTFDAVHNEGGEGYNPYRVEAERSLRDQFAAEHAAHEALFHATWTVEVTKERRAAWNAFVRANGTPRGLPTAIAGHQIEAQGWELDDLRRAIKIHNL